MIPKAPRLTCIRCNGRRFIPLTFPETAQVEDSDGSVLRPTAKCATCGLRYIGTKPWSDAESENTALPRREEIDPARPSPRDDA
jgi:hypothetical protein